MTNKYLQHGKLTAQEGHRDELADILLEAAQLVATVKGCRLYVVGKDETDKNAVYVTEIWDSKEDHDNSLKGERVKALIMKAMPLLAETPEKGQVLELLGGTGI